jgi:hypothetical protein
VGRGWLADWLNVLQRFVAPTVLFLHLFPRVWSCSLTQVKKKIHLLFYP